MRGRRNKTIPKYVSPGKHCFTSWNLLDVARVTVQCLTVLCCRAVHGGYICFACFQAQWRGNRLHTIHAPALRFIGRRPCKANQTWPPHVTCLKQRHWREVKNVHKTHMNNKCVSLNIGYLTLYLYTML